DAADEDLLPGGQPVVGTGDDDGHAGAGGPGHRQGPGPAAGVGAGAGAAVEGKIAVIDFRNREAAVGPGNPLGAADDDLRAVHEAVVGGGDADGRTGRDALDVEGGVLVAIEDQGVEGDRAVAHRLRRQAGKVAADG